MGQFMKDDDIYIGSQIDLLNLRFAPALEREADWFGGIDEMVALQKEFKIFQKGRSFRDSASILNLGGFYNVRAKNRWYTLLEHLADYQSDTVGINADIAIVTALIKNLESKSPLPVYFKPHDGRKPPKWQVMILSNDSPLFYIDQEYLTISLPMAPRRKKRMPK
jgi:hypothetical protein